MEVGAPHRAADTNTASSRTPSPVAVRAVELPNVIRPSTAGYTRFMSPMYLEKTEMSMSPARREAERLGVSRQAPPPLRSEAAAEPTSEASVSDKSLPRLNTVQKNVQYKQTLFRMRDDGSPAC